MNLSFPAASSAPSVAPNPPVIQVTAQNFMAEVMQASLKQPVVVYFTAPWCQPCQQFGPLLEQEITQSKGALKLAKIDVDKSPELAGQFGIQSVPTVYVFYQGQPADGFAGTLPQSQLQAFLKRFAALSPVGRSFEEKLGEARAALEQGDAASAERLYTTLSHEEPENAAVAGGYARALAVLGRMEEAEQILSALPESAQTHEDVTAARAALKLAGLGTPGIDAEALKAKLIANPSDHAARFALSEWHLAVGNQEAAIDALLTIIAYDREWETQKARTQLLTVFEALGFGHPLAIQGRKRLSSLLFS